MALPLAAAALIVWHLPVCYQAALRHEAIHTLEHVTLLGTALLAWWPVAGPLPEWPRPAPPAQLLYLLLAMLPMTAVAAPLTLAEGILYPFYTETAVAWPLGPRADQVLAGTVMWIGGMLACLCAGTVVFFRWATREAREDAHPGTVVLHGKP